MSVPKGTYRRHGAATEKVFGHPSIVLLKVIRSVLVAEYVNEHFTAGLQPSGKLGKEGGVSFHMFKHFNGKDVRESVHTQSNPRLYQPYALYKNSPHRAEIRLTAPFLRNQTW
jgi:hypothetical protein